MKQKAITVGVAAAASAIAFVAGGQFSDDSLEALPEPEASSELLEYQARCNLAQSWHTLYVHKASNGRMSFTMGESHRPPELAALYAKQGRGIANSLHIKRLAQDKMLLLEGKISFDPKHYMMAGEAWESGAVAFSIKPSWGGRFNDAVHFGCEWQGVK
jgi:hypothetical protein